MKIVYDGSFEEKTIRVIMGEFMPELLKSDSRLLIIDKFDKCLEIRFHEEMHIFHS